jgi:hypothetical protein
MIWPLIVSIWIAAAAGGLAHAESANLPGLDVEAGCRDISQMNLRGVTNYSNCMTEETSARAQLQKDWASYPSSVREECLNLVTPPALPSYVTLQECVQMVRDAKKLPQGELGTGETRKPRL